MDFEAIKKAAQAYGPDMTRFLRDMIAIPSESCEEKGVAHRIAEEMKKLGYDKVEFDALGLFRSHQIPEIKAIVIDKPGLNLATGAIGIGEITSIPTAPAIAQAYYRYDGERRRSLPLDHTPYKK